ncbi:cytochrome c biogenesis protein CcsA [Jeotgalicoccus meleagridis]|jgi:HemX protein|uniref:Cytochrome C assembly protein n=1 Tax=Jeotgalicoccus meleagridis TaxID=2759181 RepID=A0A6V7RIZ1_9STAP|nr:cytochrome c biogenesis protein CcsA [Jeotgalicoccus meleagridis]CAD2077128.1 Cytochrome C assembly protein [Jeotgalicoccus meleagridis]HIW38888.1 cytochrome c biogenesis protein [Candidatus Jeotgalicoccus stercoravium]
MELLFRLQEIILLLYFISLSLLSYDLFTRNRQVRKAALYVMTPAVILHFLTVVQLGMSLKRIPIMTFSEGVLTLSLGLIVLGVIHFYRNKSEFVLLFYLLITVFLLIFYTFSSLNFNSTALTLNIVNELLLVHIGSALIAYAIFFISMIHAVTFLIQERNLRKKDFNRSFFSLFSVETAKKLMIRLAFIGMLFMVISIIIGIVWGIQIIGYHVFLDLKVIGTVMLIILYALILTEMKLNGNMRRFAKSNIILFALVMINYLVISEFSNFHLWSL